MFRVRAAFCYRFPKPAVVFNLCCRKSGRAMSSIPRNSEVLTDDCLPHYEYVFKPDLLKNQVAFITGGGSGIGFRISEVLMRHGCNIAIASRRLEKVQEAAQKLEKATGQKCLALQMDVRQPDQIIKTVDAILQHYGKVDILINSAAGNFLCDAENLSFNAFKNVMDIDTNGTFHSCKVLYDKYFKQHGGNIINISATLHYNGNVMQMHAGTAKAAIDAMTKHLAVEWGPLGIRVNCIAPGPVEGTPGLSKLGGESPMAEEAKKRVPLQRYAQKAEIGDSVMYLVSNASAFVTGTVLVVDGGSWMTSMNGPDVMEIMKKLTRGKM